MEKIHVYGDDWRAMDWTDIKAFFGVLILAEFIAQTMRTYSVRNKKLTLGEQFFRLSCC